MSRVLAALKKLESRESAPTGGAGRSPVARPAAAAGEVAPARPSPAFSTPSLAPSNVRRIHPQTLGAVVIRESSPPRPHFALPPNSAVAARSAPQESQAQAIVVGDYRPAVALSQQWIVHPVAPAEAAAGPERRQRMVVPEPNPTYRQLAARIGEQFYSSETSWLGFAGLGATAFDRFSVRRLGALLAVRGDVLLVDLGQAAGAAQPGREAAGEARDLPPGIHTAGMPGVWYLPAADWNSGRTTTGLTLAEVSRLAARFRWVLLYGGLVSNSLSCALAASCRATLLLVELGRHSEAEIAAGLAALRQAGADVRGAIALASA